jgi:hypothetical protein
VKRSQDTSVNAVTTLWAGRPRNRGSIPGKGKWYFFSERAHRLCCPSSLLFKGYQELLPRVKAAGAWSWPLSYSQLRGFHGVQRRNFKFILNNNNNNNNIVRISVWRTTLYTKSVHVGVMVDKVALGQDFLRVLRFTPVGIIPITPYSFSHSSPTLL